MGRRQRLDLRLVELGLAVSRQQAQQLIRAGRVRAADRLLDKPGVEVDPGLELRVEQPPRFVSRGGEKLVAALESLPIAVRGRVCLDAGISTGGFSDCLLQHGASRVYGIDVGYGQTAWSLRTDPRLVLRERCNLRHLRPEDLYGPEDPWPDLAVADLSFISLTRVLPALKALLRPSRGSGASASQGDGPARGAAQAVGEARNEPVGAGSRAAASATGDAPPADGVGGAREAALETVAAATAAAASGEAATTMPNDPLGPEAVLLVKPQFEVGPSRVGKGGVVRDPAAHVDAIESVLAAARAVDWLPAGLLASPITGPAGNHEYLLWLSPREAPFPLSRPAIQSLVAATLRGG